MRRYKPKVIRTMSTNIIRDNVECFGQFIKINSTLWNVVKIDNIKLSEDKKYIYINTINSIKNEGENVYAIDPNNANEIFDDICDKIKYAKRIYSNQ